MHLLKRDGNAVFIVLPWPFAQFAFEAQHTIAVPIKDPKHDGKVILENQPILFPHEVLSYLWDSVKLSIPVEDVRKFWRDARAAGEPWSLETTATEEHIPVALYGDGARLSTVYQTETILGIFLSLPLFRPRSVRCSRFLLWSCEKSKCFKNRTVNKALRVITWSLNAAFHGTFPNVDMQGNVLQRPDAGKWIISCGKSFAVTELRGDWEWHKMLWRFPQCSWKANTVCYRCPALATSDNPKLLYHCIDRSAEPSCIIERML